MARRHRANAFWGVQMLYVKDEPGELEPIDPPVEPPIDDTITYPPEVVWPPIPDPTLPAELPETGAMRVHADSALLVTVGRQVKMNLTHAGILLGTAQPRDAAIRIASSTVMFALMPMEGQ